ncbi:fasciclin domain-containing protein [Anabaena cylindrica UHCC 0172]|uniref:fasciclin domain-containing protein n=1 Tax=Anabaena cylindrica TaxID=1165 RepID=UPI002B20AF34|nr:fasciclin domain-containing protein [Anabaena cylindrica]MEA5552562.1 fasciclin domain-containing protein [Anabaena cylindrica UHCC 0172]
MKASSRLLVKTVGIAIALASVLVSSPSWAKKEKHKNSGHIQSVTTVTTTSNTLIQVANTSSCGCSTFANAIRSAGWENTFSSTRSSYTMFIPSDAAFAALPVATRNKLFLPKNRAILQQVLAYHILSGTVDYKKIKPGKFKTYQGKVVEIKYKKGKLEIGKAKFKKSDLKAKNGYIHLIDTVLIPPGLLI